MMSAPLVSYWLGPVENWKPADLARVNMAAFREAHVCPVCSRCFQTVVPVPGSSDGSRCVVLILDDFSTSQTSSTLLATPPLINLSKIPGEYLTRCRTSGDTHS